MAKRKTTSTPGQPAKKLRQNSGLADLTNAQSIQKQAEPYLIATAKFPIDALTSTWSVGSNRPVDAKHVQELCQVFEEQHLQREAPKNYLRIACSRVDVQRMLGYLEGSEGLPASEGSLGAIRSFMDWMSVNECKAEIIAGQHRVEALREFFSRKNRLNKSLEEAPMWWICNIYDKDALPRRLNIQLRANRHDHTMVDSHGQVWMEVAAAAEEDQTLFQGSNATVQTEMLETLVLSSGQFPIRRLVTLWKNRRWKPMITRWCGTAVGRSTFNISLWEEMARCRIDDFWFDVLKEVLKDISQMSQQSPEAVQLSDWVSLTRLPPPRSRSVVEELFYPGATTEALGDLGTHGHRYRRQKFLGLLSHPEYHQAYSWVQEHPEKTFSNILAMFRVARQEGKVISQVMCHVVRWVNAQPTQVGDRENSKPELWRDLVPAMRKKVGSQAEEESCKLQQRIFNVVRDRIDELAQGSARDYLWKMPHDEGISYLDIFEHPIWRDILIAVHAAIGPSFQGPLARFNTRHPESLHVQQEPTLVQAMSRTISCLPEVKRNPALRNALALKTLLKRISPIMVDWAAQECQAALTAQSLGKVPPWPASVKQLVADEHSIFTKASQAQVIEDDLQVLTPPQSSSDAGAMLAEMADSMVEPPVEDSGTDQDKDTLPSIGMVVQDRSSQDTFPVDDPGLVSLELDEMEMNTRRRAHRQARTLNATTGKDEVHSGPLRAPQQMASKSTHDRLQLKVTRPLWMTNPAATSKLA